MLILTKQYISIPLFRLASVFGLINITSRELPYKLYASVIVILHISCTVLENSLFSNPEQTSNKSKEIPSTQSKDIKILRLTEDVLGLLLNLCILFTILSMVFWNNKSLKKFIEILSYFDNSFGFTPNKGYFMFACSIFEVVLFSTLQCIVTSRNKDNPVKEFFFNQALQRMTFSVAYYFRWYLVLQQTKRFEILTKHCETFLQRNLIATRKNWPSTGILLVTNKGADRNSEMNLILEELKEISKSQNSLCDAMDLLNKILGPNIVSEVIFFIGFISVLTMHIVVQIQDFCMEFGINKETLWVLVVGNISVSTAFNLIYFKKIKYYQLSFFALQLD